MTFDHEDEHSMKVLARDDNFKAYEKMLRLKIDVHKDLCFASMRDAFDEKNKILAKTHADKADELYLLLDEMKDRRKHEIESIEKMKK